MSFHIEHVIARQHGGDDENDSLCLACHWCNLFKGPNLSSLVDGETVRLFNAQVDVWSEYFQIIDGVVEGISLLGLATAKLLNMNDADRVELCRLG